MNALNIYMRCQMQRTSFYRKITRTRFLDRTKNNPWYCGPLIDHFAADSETNSEQRLRRNLEISVQLNPLPLYLRVEDRNSMANSVEARLPFLDHRLVEFVFARPDHWKISGY